MNERWLARFRNEVGSHGRYRIQRVPRVRHRLRGGLILSMEYGRRRGFGVAPARIGRLPQDKAMSYAQDLPD